MYIYTHIPLHALFTLFGFLILIRVYDFFNDVIHFVKSKHF